MLGYFEDTVCYHEYSVGLQGDLLDPRWDVFVIV